VAIFLHGFCGGQFGFLDATTWELLENFGYRKELLGAGGRVAGSRKELHGYGLRQLLFYYEL
jgi:hypothetical protein